MNTVMILCVCKIREIWWQTEDLLTLELFVPIELLNEVLQNENYWQGLLDGKDQDQQWKLQNLEGREILTPNCSTWEVYYTLLAPELGAQRTLQKSEL